MRLLRNYGAEEDAADDTALETAELGAGMGSDDDTAAEDDDIGADDDGASEDDEDTADDEDDDGASDDDGAALEITSTELDGATGFTGVGVPRLKIQMRPMMTITATMMMIQVLRFMMLDLVGRDETGKLT